MRAAAVSLAASLSVILPLAACGVANGDGAVGGDARRSFAVTGFDRVTLAGPDDISVAIGPAFAVEASADQAILDRLEVSVTDGELRVGRQESRGGWLTWLRAPRRALVRVTLPVLRGVTIAGAGNAEVAAAAAPVFVGAVEGAGNLSIRGLDARNAAFKLSGAGNLDLQGRAGNVTLQVSGAGNVSAERLEARDIDITLTGVGNIDARATGRADVRVSGVGSVDLKGTDDCRVSKSGVGSVTCGR